MMASPSTPGAASAAGVAEETVATERSSRVTAPGGIAEIWRKIELIVLSAYRLATVQGEILLLRAKLTATRVLLAAILAMAGLVGLVLGLVFLYIGVFQALALVVGTIISFLIFAGVHLVVAVALFLVARRALAKGGSIPSDKKANVSHG